MSFHNVSSIPRPVRLSRETRTYAAISLNGVYGRAARRTPYVTLDDIENFEELSAQKRCDAAIMRICSTAPLRVTPYELVAGAATLGDGINHTIPARYKGEPVFLSVSHYTPDFPRALKYGIDAYDRELTERLKNPALTDSQREVLESMQNAVAAMRVYHKRYMDVLTADGSRVSREIAESLARVPFAPPETFREAVQALWFLFSWQRLCGNWPGLGRVDEMLGPYLKRDLETGRITMDFARELIASMLIHGCEWITLEPTVSGDAQHYQNIILAGIDADGREVANDVTRLVLEVLEELPISDYPVAIRVNRETPAWVLDLAARNIRHGGGVIAVYNETQIIESMVRFGYDVRDARRFANDGCWEIQVPGETCFYYRPFDAYELLQRDVFCLGEAESPDYADFESLYAAYIGRLSDFVDELQKEIDTKRRREWGALPTPVVSLLEYGSMESARNYYDLGPRFTVASPHIGGVADVINALHTVRTLVFDERRLEFREFMDILRGNWEGHEDLRAYVRSHVTMWGNDSDAVDALGTRLMGDYIEMVERVREREGVLRPAGASTFGRQIEWAKNRFAHAHGFPYGTYLASNLCPTPGTDVEGVSAVIRSHCKLGLQGLTCGTALDVKLGPNTLTEERGTAVIEGLVRAFCELGGIFMQFDVVDNRELLDAQKHPERYRSLSVRLAGWSARFVTLSKEWQDMVIARTTQQK